MEEVNDCSSAIFSASDLCVWKKKLSLCVSLMQKPVLERLQAANSVLRGGT